MTGTLGNVIRRDLHIVDGNLVRLAEQRFSQLVAPRGDRHQCLSSEFLIRVG